MVGSLVKNEGVVSGIVAGPDAGDAASLQLTDVGLVGAGGHEKVGTHRQVHLEGEPVGLCGFIHHAGFDVDGASLLEHGGGLELFHVIVIEAEYVAVGCSRKFKVKLFSVESQVVEGAYAHLCEPRILRFHLGEEAVAVEFVGRVGEQNAYEGFFGMGPVEIHGVNLYLACWNVGGGFEDFPLVFNV